ncbi:hypothetical protein H4S00_002925, partial [Coemansia sp. D1744]
MSSFWHRVGRRSLSIERPRTDEPRTRHSLDMGTIRRSQKFFAKITWIDTLAELGRHVPLGQISVPQAVYEYD